MLPLGEVVAGEGEVQSVLYMLAREPEEPRIGRVQEGRDVEQQLERQTEQGRGHLGSMGLLIVVSRVILL